MSDPLEAFSVGLGAGKKSRIDANLTSESPFKAGSRDDIDWHRGWRIGFHGYDNVEDVSGYCIDRTLAALRELQASAEDEASSLIDDFNHFTVRDLGRIAGESLWHLTRGREGIPNTLELSISTTEDTREVNHVDGNCCSSGSGGQKDNAG